MRIRPETSLDWEAIEILTTRAFAGAEHSSGTEAAIVDGLRKAKALHLSLVLENQGEILGHVAFSPVLIGGVDHGWMGLGPVSVAPERQRAGLGRGLIREGLALLMASGCRGCVVLGDPNYYRKFGFEPDPQIYYPGVPAKYFMRLSFGPDCPGGEVRYHSAFG